MRIKRIIKAGISLFILSLVMAWPHAAWAIGIGAGSIFRFDPVSEKAVIGLDPEEGPVVGLSKKVSGAADLPAEENPGLEEAAGNMGDIGVITETDREAAWENGNGRTEEIAAEDVSEQTDETDGKTEEGMTGETAESGFEEAVIEESRELAEEAAADLSVNADEEADETVGTETVTIALYRYSSDDGKAVNIREEPTTQSRIVDSVRPGMNCIMYEADESGEWLHIIYESVDQVRADWVKSEFFELVEEYTLDIPSAENEQQRIRNIWDGMKQISDEG